MVALSAVVLLAGLVLAVLVVSRSPALTAEIVGSAVAVCSLAWSVAGAVVARMRKPVAAVDTAQVVALPAVVPTGLLPPIVRDRSFEFGQLRRWLRRPSRGFIVLTGMAGVGKSTIACEFAGRVERRSMRWRKVDVWFVSAADPSSLAGALVTVARDLGGVAVDLEAIGASRPDAPERLWRLLHDARRKWLLIMDNADDPAVLARPVSASMPGDSSGPPADGAGWIRPSRRGLVVVTSRLDDPAIWGKHARIIRVRPLEEPHAIQVLLDRAPHAGDADHARPLAKTLRGLPLTLKNAGSYLNLASVSGRSFGDYEAKLLMTAKPELRIPVSDRDVPLLTFEISLNYLDRVGVPQARPLLRLLSCYASPTPIPRDLLRPEQMSVLLAQGGETNPRYELEHGLQQLTQLSLIEFERGDIVLHPVVADSCRAHLDADDDGMAVATSVRHVAVELMASALGEVGLEGPLHIETMPAQWPVLVRYGPHLHALFATVADRLDDAHIQDLLKAATSMAYLYHHHGSVAEAMNLAQVALKRVDLLPDDQADTLATRHYLAWFLVLLRRSEEAEKLYRNVLANREVILGASHPDTLWTRHELAWVKASRGQWPEAEAAYREVLQKRHRVLGDDDPATLMTRHELGWTIANQGRGEEAESILNGVLAGRERILGSGHRRTIWTRHELAWAIAIQGRWAEAEALYRAVLRMRDGLLRADHPDVMIAKQELAWTVAEQGRRAEALGMYQGVLAARRATLGADDPATKGTSLAIDALRRGQITTPRHLA